MARDLIEVLREAKQEVPPELERMSTMAPSGRGGRHRGGGGGYGGGGGGRTGGNSIPVGSRY